ncbi:MAG: hypothetical protein WD491_02630, partial [Balneolales bacterium]
MHECIPGKRGRLPQQSFECSLLRHLPKQKAKSFPKVIQRPKPAIYHRTFPGSTPYQVRTNSNKTLAGSGSCAGVGRALI